MLIPKPFRSLYGWRGSYLCVTMRYTVPKHTPEEKRREIHDALVAVSNRHEKTIALQAAKVAEELEKRRKEKDGGQQAL